MPKYTIGQLIYVIRSPLIKLTIDSKAEKYNKVLRRARSAFSATRVTEHILTVDENGILNIISINRTTHQ